MPGETQSFKRNKMLLHAASDITFDRLVGIIVDEIGLDHGHCYEFTVVIDGTTRKRQLENGIKIVADDAIPSTALIGYYDFNKHPDLENILEKESHFTSDTLNIVKWDLGMKMWLLYDFGDMNYFIITCKNVINFENQDRIRIHKHFTKYDNAECLG